MLKYLPALIVLFGAIADSSQSLTGTLDRGVSRNLESCLCQGKIIKIPKLIWHLH
jgi:hypothetical protein